MLIAANTDIHWAAGFIDGEGTIQQQGTHSIGISACQKDRWHLEKLQSIFGGTISFYTYPDKQKSGVKSYHVWGLSGKKAAGVVSLLRPLMSPRRQLKIDEVLSGWRTGPKPGTYNRSKTHCKNGHEFTTDNIILKKPSGRECRKCAKLNKAKWYQINKLNKE